MEPLRAFLLSKAVARVGRAMGGRQPTGGEHRVAGRDALEPGDDALRARGLEQHAVDLQGQRVTREAGRHLGDEQHQPAAAEAAARRRDHGEHVAVPRQQRVDERQLRRVPANALLKVGGAVAAPYDAQSRRLEQTRERIENQGERLGENDPCQRCANV